ncbi:PAS domain-containing protein [Phycicoccus sp. M110.8]|uniref:sensor histidine kinase n=1 Tax=Phycicoccus sp. M110.8 TaxID=3075433 RepID=UPI0028FD516A|nr:PAS domain-containing protein [Phycicoccus sp. M110.8]MDU0313297.1 PAS domain-containing protein [Phycicoccus sp. M110.8]HET8768516.1 PAS domain-containing protein [Pedococcus sp.]
MDTKALPPRPSADELLDALGHAVIATDTQGTVLSWNGAAEQLYGWPAAEAVGRDIAEVTVPELSRKAAEEIMTALRDGRSWSGGFPVRNRSGAVLHALVTDSGVYRDGKLIGIVGASLNLGDAVRHLMERSSDAAVLLDANHLVSYASPAVATLFGWAVDEVMGTPLTDRIHPEDHHAFGELLATDPPRAERIGELRVRTDGAWTWVEVAVTDLYAQPGPQGQVCNIRRSERLTRLEERERILEAVHSEVLQDLFAAALELDRALAHAPSSSAVRIHGARDAVGRAMRTLREVVKP